MVARKIEVEYFHDVAEEIRDIHAAMQDINASGLKETTIIVLLQHLTGENESTIKRVLWGLQSMESLVK